MNKNQIVKFTALFALSVFIVLAFVSIDGQAQTNEKAEDAVRKILIAHAEAIEQGDLQALDKIWSNDPAVLVFENGGVNNGWENYRNKHLAPELKSFKNLKFAVSDIVVKADKKIAWATYKYTLAADFNKQKIDTGGIGTMIFEKKDGKWLIVHSHTSAGF